MRKFMNIVMILLVAVVLIGGGAAGYVWYATKKQADAVVALARPLAHISYGGISVSPLGSVSIHQVRIAPNTGPNTLTVGTIRLSAPDFLALLQTGWQVRRGRLPQALALSFRELELRPGTVTAAGSSQNTPAHPLDNLSALGCGPISAFGPSEWRDMGYQRLLGNLEIGYRINSLKNILELRLDSSARDMATTNLDFGLALSGAPRSFMELATTFTPKLAKLNLALRDDGLNQRRNTYCANKAGKPILDYIADHVRLVDERLRALGVVLGPGWLTAYQRYLTEGGVLALTATPPIPINPAELPDYAPADLIKLLGLRLNVNDTGVTDLSASWNTAQLMSTFGIQPQEQLQREYEAAAEKALIAAPARPTIAPKAYHPLPADQLSQHIGKIAKLRTTSGVQYRGQLHPAEDGLVRITLRQASGSATLSLRVAEITSAEVLY